MARASVMRRPRVACRPPPLPHARRRPVAPLDLLRRPPVNTWGHRESQVSLLLKNYFQSSSSRCEFFYKFSKEFGASARFCRMLLSCVFSTACRLMIPCLKYFLMFCELFCSWIESRSFITIKRFYLFRKLC